MSVTPARIVIRLLTLIAMVSVFTLVVGMFPPLTLVVYLGAMAAATFIEFALVGPDRVMNSRPQAWLEVASVLVATAAGVALHLLFDLDSSLLALATAGVLAVIVAAAWLIRRPVLAHD